MGPKIRIGDYVSIDGELFDSKKNIFGTVTNICTHHIVIKDQYGFMRSVINADIHHLHLIRPSGFKSYSEEKRRKDIGEA